jgi:hypothetical protein
VTDYLDAMRQNDNQGVAVYYLKKQKREWIYENIMISDGFSVLDSIGQVVNPTNLSKTIKNNHSIKEHLDAYDDTLKDGRERIIRYNSSAPGYSQPRIAIVRKLNSRHICCIVREDRRRSQ